MNYKLSKLLSTLLAASFGCLIVLFHIPWSLVFNGSTVTGGDVPGHLYLIASLQDALRDDFSIRHYAFGFWCGFPLFLFYFPFPYLVGALLAVFFDLSAAFKILTVVPYFLVPLSFAYFARSLGASRLLQAAASLLGVSWFFTDAHVMWGGNALSTLSGMVAQAWAMPLVVFALAALLQAQRSGKNAFVAIAFGAAAVLSHFYAALLLGFVIGLLVAQDLLFVWRKLPCSRRSFYLAVGGVLVVTLWWYLPLFLNVAQSSEFGGHWDVNLSETFSLRQKIGFVSVFVISLCGLIFRRALFLRLLPFVLLVGIGLLFFAGSFFSSSTAFNNIRFWPLLFLALYLLTVSCIVVVAQRWSRAALLLLLFVFCCHWPSATSFESSRSWLVWNFSGVEAKSGANDFKQIISLLRSLPSARVSAESDDAFNEIFGSVRVFELIPALTEHEFVEGAIVNSARLPGISYFLQCLTSRSCAGWPPGSLMPEFDPARGVSMMQSLGVSYHVASNKTFDWSSLSNQGLKRLFKGEFVSLYQLQDVESLVEVFEVPLPSVNASDARAVILQLPRWDFFRINPVVFSTTATVTADDFLRVLVSQWLIGERVADRGYLDRFSRREKYRNIFSFAEDRAAARLPTFFIADRPFEPSLFLPSAFEKDVSVLYEEELGAVRLDESFISARGFVMRSLASNPQRLFFSVDWRDEFPQLDIELEQPQPVELRAVDNLASRRITQDCGAKLEKRTNELRLFTRCVDKPHLLKYSFSEHWHYDGPIYIASNGFIVVTPKVAETKLTWRK